ERAQRVERLGRRRLAPRHLTGQLEQLPPALLEDGAVERRLAREDGVDATHREPGQARDVLQLGRREAALGEHLLRGLDDVAPVDAGARPARLVPGPAAGGHRPPLYHHRSRLTSRISEW